MDREDVVGVLSNAQNASADFVEVALVTSRITTARSCLSDPINLQKRPSVPKLGLKIS
jgi:hypothetical protein